MRKVEQNNYLVMFFCFINNLFLKGLKIKSAIIRKQGILAYVSLFSYVHNHVVVAPHHIRQYDHVSGVYPEICKHTYSMSYAAGNNRDAYMFICKGRVFFKYCILPDLP